MHRLLILALLAAPTPLLAQGSPSQSSPTATPPSSMGRWDGYRARQEEMRRQDDMRESRPNQLVPQQQVINDFAACIWQQSPDRARAALTTAIDTDAERSALRSVAEVDACSDRLLISGRSGEFRGALAETGIHADAARKARIDALAPVSATRVPVARGRAFVASYSACIAAADPAGSMALLATTPGAPVETDAVRAMADAMTGCMPEGAQYRVDVRDVRNHIADALYRMSEVPGA